MAFCKYHPLRPATYRCHQCETSQCDSCVNEASKRHEAECFLCGKPLESLGVGHAVEPFWRRLESAFRYPLNSNAISLMVAVAIGSVVLGYLPGVFAFLVSIVLIGAILKYSFKCLESTSEGDMTSPDITEAYSGGVGLLFSLIAVIVLIGIFIGVVAKYIGFGMASFVGFLAYISFPAILIRFALTESIFQALNPMANFHLVVAIGLPYVALIGLLIVMMGSVAFIHQLLGTEYSFISTVLGSIVTNYYLIVSFHIMGYMLFQYQDRLGYSARITGQGLEERSDADRQLAAIDVHIKEGEYSKAIDLFYQSFKIHSKDIRFFDNYFNFILRAEKPDLIREYADTYLQALVKFGKFEKLLSTYKLMLNANPDFVPEAAEVRLAIARSAKTQGNHSIVIKLVNGMHKKYPEYSALPEAYELLADVLQTFPGRQAQAQKSRALAVALRNRNGGARKGSIAVGEKKSITDKAHQLPPHGELKLKENDASLGESKTGREGKREADEGNKEGSDLPPIEFKL